MKDGGPAFPSHGSMGEVTHEGMSLRDYFATAAIPELTNMMTAVSDPTGASARVSKMAYEIADAMLAERDK